MYGSSKDKDNKKSSKKKKVKDNVNVSFPDHDKYVIVRENSVAAPDTDYTSPNRRSTEATIFVQALSDVNNCYRTFYKNHTCYDLIPESSKLVIFDINLNIKKAYYALVYNGVRAAILWNPSAKHYVGMFTISDFIKVLMKYYHSDMSLDDMEANQISTWMDLEGATGDLFYVTPETSLFDAIQVLLQHKVHRLPVIDRKGTSLHILTHKRVLKYLSLNMYQLPVPSYLKKTLEELNVGTLSNVAVLTTDQTIIDALTLFINRRISALPIVDAASRNLVDIYSKFDVISLAANRTYDKLDVNIMDALKLRAKRGVATCTKKDTFGDVMKKLMELAIHRLVVVDSENHVEGVLSLSDVLELLTTTHPSV